MAFVSKEVLDGFDDRGKGHRLAPACFGGVGEKIVLDHNRDLTETAD